MKKLLFLLMLCSSYSFGFLWGLGRGGEPRHDVIKPTAYSRDYSYHIADILNQDKRYIKNVNKKNEELASEVQRCLNVYYTDEKRTEATRELNVKDSGCVILFATLSSHYKCYPSPWKVHSYKQLIDQTLSHPSIHPENAEAAKKLMSRLDKDRLLDADTPEEAQKVVDSCMNEIPLRICKDCQAPIFSE